MYRFKCECGCVYDSKEEALVCPKCGKINSTEGMGIIQVYRMGSPIGIAVPEELYIDGNGFGVLMNKQTAKLVLPYGTHTVHCALTMNRNCNDQQITLTEENNAAYVKAAIKAGFFVNKIRLTICNKEDMPQD